MYVQPNFKTKKALKEAVKAYTDDPAKLGRVSVFSPGPFPCKENGLETVEGPHYPEPHRWYAQVEVVDGIVVRVN